MRIFPVTDERELTRVVHAIKIDAQSELIAKAFIVEDQILIANCANRIIKLSFNEVPSLSKISKKNRGDFEIHKFGNYIKWTKDDIHLDFESLLYFADEEFKKKTDKEAKYQTLSYGAAIKSFREESNIPQSKIDLSDRQVRRIEKGEQKSTMKSLEIFAEAHDLSLQQYLTEIKKRMVE